MKFTLEIEAHTPDELLTKIRSFCSQRIIAGDVADAEIVAETAPPPPKAAKAKANGKVNGKVNGDKPAEKKTECRDKPYSEAEVRTAMIDLVNAASEKEPDKSRKEIFKTLLDKFGVEKLADLPEDKYQDMVDLVATVKAGL